MSTEVDVGRIVESTNVHCKLRVLMSYKTRYRRRHKTILGRDKTYGGGGEGDFFLSGRKYHCHINIEMWNI
jgi:hypothetical protein